MFDPQGQSWSQRTVGYGDGKRVTEYSDKRKKDKNFGKLIKSALKNKQR